MFEFLVDSINPEGLVIGRNGQLNIPVGTTFTAVRRRRVLSSPHECRTDDLGDVGTVSLKLRNVYWYRQSIAYVPGGHTAALGVEGEGLELLAHLLSDLPRGEYLSLTAPTSQNC